MNNEFYHHGIKGQRWGVRRFENKDGSLTPAGKKRYDDGPSKKEVKKKVKEMKKSGQAPVKHPVAKAILKNALPMAAATYLSSVGMTAEKAGMKMVGDVGGWVVMGNTIRQARKGVQENREAARKELRK